MNYLLSDVDAWSIAALEPWHVKCGCLFFVGLTQLVRDVLLFLEVWIRVLSHSQGPTIRSYSVSLDIRRIDTLLHMAEEKTWPS